MIRETAREFAERVYRMGNEWSDLGADIIDACDARDQADGDESEFERIRDLLASHNLLMNDDAYVSIENLLKLCGVIR